MNRMVRKQIYLEKRQDERLKARARELGISEAELIRRCIDLAEHEPFTHVPDLRIWEDEMELIRQRIALNIPQTGRSWPRDELYDQRLERYSR